jgi:hypothetical protein
MYIHGTKNLRPRSSQAPVPNLLCSLVSFDGDPASPEFSSSSTPLATAPSAPSPLIKFISQRSRPESYLPAQPLTGESGASPSGSDPRQPRPTQHLVSSCSSCRTPLQFPAISMPFQSIRENPTPFQLLHFVTLRYTKKTHFIHFQPPAPMPSAPAPA